jgi:hypothetical protein
VPCTANAVPPPPIFLPMRLPLGTLAFVFVVVVATGCDRGRTGLPAATLLKPTRTNRRRRRAASTRPATAEITARSRHQSPDLQVARAATKHTPARRQTSPRPASAANPLPIRIAAARALSDTAPSQNRARRREQLPNPHRRRGPNVRSSTSALRCVSQPISRAARIQYLYTPFR